MSNGDPPPASTATYIIICSRRTAVAAAKTVQEKIVNASMCAAELCSFIETQHDVQPADFAAVSALQHEMMDNLQVWKEKEAEAKIAEMFDLLDALEDKFSET